MKWPFSRKKDVSSVPAEIQEYYQTERRERTGIAWLLALGTLLITIGLAALLFFGGRWIYRTVVDNDDDNQETAQTEQGEEATETPEGTPSEQGTQSSGTSSTSTSTPNTSTPQQSTAGANTSQPSGSTTQTTTSTPVTGDGLPDTGPGDVVAIFTATAITAGAAHYAISTRRDS